MMCAASPACTCESTPTPRLIPQIAVRADGQRVCSVTGYRVSVCDCYEYDADTTPHQARMWSGATYDIDPSTGDQWLCRHGEVRRSCDEGGECPDYDAGWDSAWRYEEPETGWSTSKELVHVPRTTRD